MFLEVNILTNLANMCENVLAMPEKARKYRRALRGEEAEAEPCAICLDALDGRPQIASRSSFQAFFELRGWFRTIFLADSITKGTVDDHRRASFLGSMWALGAAVQPCVPQRVLRARAGE